MIKTQLFFSPLRQASEHICNFAIICLVSIVCVQASAGTTSTPAQESGLVVHAAEIGIGKFHRQDNKIHGYDPDNMWRVFVLPPTASTTTPLLVPQDDGSYTIFYSTLEELLTSLINLSVSKKQRISLLNMNAHGMPGGMWFPKDDAEKNSKSCLDWRESVLADDAQNYDDYYSVITKDEIMETRKLSNIMGGKYDCTTELNDWQEVTGRLHNLKGIFTSDFQLHFFSCNVGLGKRGRKFTEGVAAILLNSSQGKIQSAMQFGLGDWSLPEGMGFWTYQNDEQLQRDNENYVRYKKDAEQAQLGSIRVATLDSKLQPVSGLLQNVWYMFGHRDDRDPLLFSSQNLEEDLSDNDSRADAPTSLRIPGTRVRALKTK